MFRFAHRHNDKTVFYFDIAGNKYVASAGHLTWRINNPGLMHYRSQYSRSNGSIGNCGRYAIFSHPAQGHKALSDWLCSKKYYNSTLHAIAEYYQPLAPHDYLDKLVAYSELSSSTKIKNFNEEEF